MRLRSHPDQPICHDCLAGLDAQRDGQLELLAGSWLVRGFQPIFKVTDVAASASFYESLGFEVSVHDDAYAFAHREIGLTIHLARALAGDVVGGGSLYLHCQDADRVADDWRRAGAIVEGPRDEDHGRREGSAVDPDGNVLRFGAVIR